MARMAKIERAREGSLGPEGKNLRGVGEDFHGPQGKNLRGVGEDSHGPQRKRQEQFRKRVGVDLGRECNF